MTQEMTTPRHWNRFWETKTSARYGRISWSKTRIMEVLRPFLHEGMSVIDAGCGSGFFSSYFLHQKCRVWSIDYAKASLEIARKNTLGKCEDYINADLLENADWTKSFQKKIDLIFTDGLFEHFAEQKQKKLMEYFRIVLKPGGIVATFVPNRYSWWQLVRPWIMPGIRETPFLSKDLRQLHKNMRILKTGGISVLPFRFSPEKTLGNPLGMILYCLASIG